MVQKTYSEEFKEEALAYLKALNDGNTCLIEGKTIKTVAQLVDILEISRDSLYRWRKNKEKKREFIEAQKLEKREKEAKEGFLKSNNIDFEKAYDFTKDIEEIETFLKKERKEKFGKEVLISRFWSWFAYIMDIEEYQNLTLPYLKLKIGLKLIDECGLINGFLKEGLGK